MCTNLIGYNTELNLNELFKISESWINHIFNNKKLQYWYLPPEGIEDDENEFFTHNEIVKVLEKRSYGTFGIGDEKNKFFITINKTESIESFLFYSNKNIQSTDLLEKILKINDLVFPFNYGFFYETNDMYDSIEYTSGGWIESMPDYEKAWAWQKSVHSEDLKHRKGLLRLVYEDNFLSNLQLSAKVNPGKTLQQWIIENDYGKLKKINEKMYIWHVSQDELININKILGGYNFLICFEK